MTDSSCLPDTQAKPTPVCCVYRSAPHRKIGTLHPDQQPRIFSEDHEEMEEHRYQRETRALLGDRRDFSSYREERCSSDGNGSFTLLTDRYNSFGDGLVIAEEDFSIEN